MLWKSLITAIVSIVTISMALKQSADNTSNISLTLSQHSIVFHWELSEPEMTQSDFIRRQIPLATDD